MPIKKYVRLDENNRILEKYTVEADTLNQVRKKFKNKITKEYHADYVNYFIEVDDSHSPEYGQQWNGTTFKDYVPSIKERNHKNKRFAQKEIINLQNQAIELLISASTDPAVVAIKAKIDIEKNNNNL